MLGGLRKYIYTKYLEKLSIKLFFRLNFKRARNRLLSVAACAERVDVDVVDVD